MKIHAAEVWSVLFDLDKKIFKAFDHCGLVFRFMVTTDGCGLNLLFAKQSSIDKHKFKRKSDDKIAAKKDKDDELVRQKVQKLNAGKKATNKINEDKRLDELGFEAAKAAKAYGKEMKEQMKSKTIWAFDPNKWTLMSGVGRRPEDHLKTDDPLNPQDPSKDYKETLKFLYTTGERNYDSQKKRNKNITRYLLTEYYNQSNVDVKGLEK